MESSTQYLQIEGSVQSVVFQNPENGYTVLRLFTHEEGAVTAVGCMPGVSPGERLVLTGTWTTHHAFGPQFKAEWTERHLPTSRNEIFEYLSSGAIKGIGPAKVRDIVDAFGDQALDIIENEPERLSELRGITKKLAVELSAWFRRQVGLRRLMEFLGRYDLKPHVAVNLYKCYGDEAMAAVRDNPYILVSDFIGADFFQADALALKLGFEADSAQRVEAAVLFELSHNLNNGHTFLPWDKLTDATGQLIGTDREQTEDALEALIECGYVVRETVAGQNACYLAEVNEAERFVAQRIAAMALTPPLKKQATEKLLTAVERELSIQYAEGQRRAVELAAESQIMVLTGGPGTGKTTSVRGILSLFDKLGLKTALCAPTGRAAKRLGELTGRDATTIHRMLGAAYSAPGDALVFERCESDPVQADAVVVDETSMVDILLMRSLLSAMRPDCRLVLVGDADQLPSVGPGNVFSDILRSGLVAQVKLTEIFRQAGESRIVRNAHLINSGTVPDLGENSGDFFFLQRGSAEKTADTIVDLCCERLPNKMGILPSQIQVLSPTRKYDAGTGSLNKRLQAAVNPPSGDKKEKIFGDFVFREGDRVMQIRNNYDILWKSEDGLTAGTGVFNGDIGQILQLDLQQESIVVDYEDKLVTYSFEQLGELEPAYALTVHKAQGSEYRAVILALSSGASQLLTRSVLYTAVTRARELLIVVGDREIVSQMTGNDRRQRRYSGLRARLCDHCG